MKNQNDDCVYVILYLRMQICVYIFLFIYLYRFDILIHKLYRFYVWYFKFDRCVIIIF